MKKIIVPVIVIIIVALIVGLAMTSKNTRQLRDDEITITPSNSDDDTNQNTPGKHQALPDQAGLPATIEAKRQAIYAAALSRDYGRLASEADPTIRYSFGGPVAGGFEGFMKLSEKNEGKSAFEIIPKLLALPYDLNGNMYVWPSVFNKEASQWNDEDIAMMRTLLTDEQIESYRKFGAYAYYRLGITTDGKWIYYLAGD